MDLAQLARRVLADARTLVTRTQHVEAASDRLQALEAALMQALRHLSAAVATVLTLTATPASCLLLPPRTAHVLIVRQVDADTARGLLGVPDDAPLPPQPPPGAPPPPPELVRAVALSEACDAVIVDLSVSVPRQCRTGPGPVLAAAVAERLAYRLHRLDKRARADVDVDVDVDACCDSLKRLCT